MTKAADHSEAPLQGIGTNWRETDAQNAMKLWNLEVTRDPERGYKIWPENFVMMLQELRVSLDYGYMSDENAIFVRQGIKQMLDGIEYDRPKWEQDGILELLPTRDGYAPPHVLGLIAFSTPVKDRPPVKQRKRSAAPVTSRDPRHS